MTSRQAEYPRPNHFLVHLSDTHVLGTPGGLYGSSADSDEQVARVAAQLERLEGRPEAIIVTGDLADQGEAAAYERLRRLIAPVAQRIGAELIWVMGNHDRREPFREHLLGLAPTGGPVDRAYEFGGLRVIALDTSVPGHHHGEVSDDQLDWLAAELATPAPHGTILALHHPPIPSAQDLAVLVELRDQHRLARVLAGSDVRAILGGHLHYSSTATFAGIPVSVASATCYTQDLGMPGRGTRGRDGAQSFNLVHVYEHTVLHSVVPIGIDETVGEVVDSTETARRLAAAGVTIADAPAAPAPVEPALEWPVAELVDA